MRSGDDTGGKRYFDWDDAVPVAPHGRGDASSSASVLRAPLFRRTWFLAAAVGVLLIAVMLAVSVRGETSPKPDSSPNDEYPLLSNAKLSQIAADQSAFDGETFTAYGAVISKGDDQSSDWVVLGAEPGTCMIDRVDEEYPNNADLNGETDSLNVGDCFEAHILSFPLGWVAGHPPILSATAVTRTGSVYSG